MARLQLAASTPHELGGNFLPGVGLSHDLGSAFNGPSYRFAKLLAAFHVLGNHVRPGDYSANVELFDDELFLTPIGDHIVKATNPGHEVILGTDIIIDDQIVPAIEPSDIFEQPDACGLELVMLALTIGEMTVWAVRFVARTRFARNQMSTVKSMFKREGNDTPELEV